MDDVATMEVGDRRLATDTVSSKLVYFDGNSGGDTVALEGDRGPSGATGLKGDSGGRGPVEFEVPLESVALKDLNVLERLIRWDRLEHVVELEHVVKRLQGRHWLCWSAKTCRSTG